MDGLPFLNEVYTHGVSKFLNIVMLELLKDLLNNLVLEFISLFVLDSTEGLLISQESLLYEFYGVGDSWMLNFDPS